MNLPNKWQAAVGQTQQQRVCFRCHTAHSTISETTKLKLFEIVKKIGVHERPQFLTPVYYTWLASPPNTGASERALGVMMIGKYRVIILPLTGGKVQMRFLCDLRQVKSTCPAEMFLEFRKLYRLNSSYELGVHPQMPGSSDIKIETTRGTDLIKAICDSFFSLVPPFNLVLKICAEHAGPLKDRPLERKNEKSALVSRYIAMSDYLSTVPNSNVALFLSHKIETKDHSLDLDALPTEEEDSNESAAVATCLRGLTAFSEVSCTSSHKPVPFVCYGMRFSETITHLRLVSRRGEVEELGRAMKANPAMPLQSLDLSESLLNNINTVIWLAGGLRVLTRGLESVNFSDCSLTPKAVAFLVTRGLAANQMMDSLNFLDMSRNEFRKNGTQAIGAMIMSLANKGCANITKLKLNDCELDMNLFLSVLPSLSKLKLLNIGKNILGVDNTPKLLNVLKDRTIPLQSLDVSGTSLDGNEVRLITHTFLSSRQTRCRLKIGNNVFSSKLFPSAGGGWALDVLDLSDSLLSPSLFLTITKRLSAKDMRPRTLVLHRALGDCPEDECLSLGKSTAEMVMNSPHLVALVLSGGYSIEFLTTFLDGIALNKTLYELDLRKNDGGDTLLFHLAHILSHNASLLSLYVDENMTTDKGWQALALVLEKSNKTVQNMAFPWIDFHSRMSNSTRSAPRQWEGFPGDNNTLRDSSWAKFHTEAQKVMQQLYIHRCQMREPFQSILESRDDYF